MKIIVIFYLIIKGTSLEVARANMGASSRIYSIYESYLFKIVLRVFICFLSYNSSLHLAVISEMLDKWMLACSPF